MSHPAEVANRKARNNALPPPPPGTRYVCIPRCPTIVADDECRHRVDRWFFWPMIVLALAVLPLIAIELFYIDRADGVDRSFLGWLCWVGFAIISLAFLIEFIIKITIAESRIEYLKRNWIDVIIIVLPALRPLRATALLRSGRMFSLRGAGTRLFRLGFTFIVGLEATERYAKMFGINAASGRKQPDRMTRHELMTELTRLRRKCDSWEAWYDAYSEFLRDSQSRAEADACPAMPPRPVVSDEQAAVEPIQTRGPTATDAAQPAPSKRRIVAG